MALVSGRNPDHKFTATWDTGATHSVISQNVINVCKLKRFNTWKVHTTSGAILTRTYFVDIVLPKGNRPILFPEVEVTKGEIGIEGIEEDVLIGMDIIGLGDFAVTNFNQVTKFSFRVPSLEHIDFEEQERLRRSERN